jgi:DNA-binding beta-propeller fold protein YncE
MKYSIIVLFIFSVFLACNPAHNSGTTTSNYKITNRIHLDGDGFWDYLAVDAATDRLFVSHGTQVQVVDLKTGKLSGTIPDTKGVHGIAIANDLGKGFISCGRDTSVMIFDLITLQVTGKIKVTGANPDAILYDPFTKRVFSFNHNGKNATAIDAVTGKILATIALEGEVEFAVTDGKGTIYVNLEDVSKIAVIDSKNLKVLNNWSVAPGEEPTGLAFDVKNNRLFSVCGNQKMIVMNSKTGKIVQTLPIGDGTDGVDFDPAVQRIYSSNGEGTMTVVAENTPDEFSVLATVSTQKGARTIAMNPQTHHLYLPTAEREAPVGNERPAVKAGTFMVLEIAETSN